MQRGVEGGGEGGQGRVVGTIRTELFNTLGYTLRIVPYFPQR